VSHHDPYFAIRQENAAEVGPVDVRVFQLPSGKWGYSVKIDGDDLGDKRLFRFDGEAQDAATSAIKLAEDIRDGKARHALMIDGAARRKGHSKRLLLFFAKHFDRIADG